MGDPLLYLWSCSRQIYRLIQLSQPIMDTLDLEEEVAHNKWFCNWSGRHVRRLVTKPSGWITERCAGCKHRDGGCSYTERARKYSSKHKSCMDRPIANQRTRTIFQEHRLVGHSTWASGHLVQQSSTGDASPHVRFPRCRRVLVRAQTQMIA